MSSKGAKFVEILKRCPDMLKMLDAVSGLSDSENLLLKFMLADAGLKREGPWIKDKQLHPDASYSFEHKGLQCEVKCMGDYNWNGYVTVPNTHKAYNKDHNNDLYHIDVHGGVTYGKTNEDGTTYGFDTAHGGDISHFDILMGDINKEGATYKDFDFVKAETIKLAEQLNEYKLTENKEENANGKEEEKEVESKEENNKKRKLESD
jgi:hypothetical protein